VEEWQKVIHSNQFRKKASKRQQSVLCQCKTQIREKKFAETPVNCFTMVDCNPIDSKHTF
jgi:hypothetical protein